MLLLCKPYAGLPASPAGHQGDVSASSTYDVGDLCLLACHLSICLSLCIYILVLGNLRQVKVKIEKLEVSHSPAVSKRA